MNPRSAHTQVILLHKHQHTFDILHSLFPRRSQPVLVLQTTVGGGEDLGMKLLLCRCMQVGKGSAIGTIMHYIQLPHAHPTMHCIPLVDEANNRKAKNSMQSLNFNIYSESPVLS